MAHRNPDRTPKQVPPRRRLRKVAVGALATLLAVVAAEVVCRRLPDPWLRPDLAPFLEPDPVLGWRHRAHSQGTVRGADFEALVNYDADGNRPLPAPPDAASGPRLLLLGDSFLDAYSVPEAEHLATLLQDLLRNKAPGVSLHNLGTVGYSTDQELLQYERWTASHPSDLVVLFFHDNDVAGNGQQHAQLGAKPCFRLEQGRLQPMEPRSAAEVETPSPEGTRRWLRRHSALYWRIMTFVRGRPSWQGAAVRRNWMRPLGHPLIEVHGRLVPAEYLLYLREPPAPLEDWWRVTEALLRRLQERCQEQGSRLLLVRIPIRAELEQALWEDLLTSHALEPDAVSPDLGRLGLERICEAQGIPLLDAREALGAEDGEQAWLPVDGHWTAAGHARVAAWLADRLVPHLPPAGGAD